MPANAADPPTHVVGSSAHAEGSPAHVAGLPACHWNSPPDSRLMPPAAPLASAHRAFLAVRAGKSPAHAAFVGRPRSVAAEEAARTRLDRPPRAPSPPQALTSAAAAREQRGDERASTAPPAAKLCEREARPPQTANVCGMDKHGAHGQMRYASKHTKRTGVCGVQAGRGRRRHAAGRNLPDGRRASM